MNMKVKRLATTMLAVALVTSGAVTTFSDLHAASSKSQAVQQAQVTLKWNGKNLSAKGIMSNGQTLIPITVLKDDLKLPVSYNASNKFYVIKAGFDELTMMTAPEMIKKGSDVSILVNKVEIHDKARMIDKQLYVPGNVLKGYLGIDVTGKASSKTVSLTKSSLQPGTVKAVSLWKKNSGKLKIDIKYPQLIGKQLGVAKINAVLKKYEEQTVANIKKELKQMGEPAPGHKYVYSSVWQVTYGEQGYISLVIDNYSDTGGAHGNTIRKAFTFSVVDGKQLGLGDVLKANPDYKNVLNSKLLKLLSADKGYLESVNKGLVKPFKGLSGQPDFYVTSTGIVVFFQQYEYTPYSSGFPKFSFSYKELLPAGAKLFGK